MQLQFNSQQGSALFPAAKLKTFAATPSGNPPPQNTANSINLCPVFSHAYPIVKLTMPIQHITELFALNGRDFITEAYRNLLKREPDEHGMAYYMGRLAQGYGKAAVIAQLAQSTECRSWNGIKGLKRHIADERRAQHWFFGFFLRQTRIEKELLGAIRNHTLVEQLVLNELVKLPKPLEKNSQYNNTLTKHEQDVKLEVTPLARYDALVKKINEIVDSKQTETGLTLDQISLLLKSQKFKNDLFFEYFMKVEL